MTVITEDVNEAAHHIRSGSLVAFPTETVYGLGADATNEEAVLRIYKAKGRPKDNPVIVHIADFMDLSGVAESISVEALALMKAFFPGPLTLVLDRHPGIPDVVSAGLPTVGVRMPAHKLAIRFIRAAECPIAAPSANLSGFPSPTTWQAVREDLDGKISCILRGEQSVVGLESTVVDCARKDPVLLRSGNVTLDQLKAVVPSVRPAESEDLMVISSPGLLHKHYAPRARVEMVQHPSDIGTEELTVHRCGYIGLTEVSDPSRFLRSERAVDLIDYAYRLFEFFRECDRAGVEIIYCQMVEATGLGVAVMDRLERAAKR